MAEPTSVYSIRDLILRVAKAAGIAYYGSDGQGKAVIPVDDHDFERCLDVVNDGIKLFIASAPRSGWRWRNQIAEVTFGAVETAGTVDSGDATTLVDATLSSTYDEDDDVNGYYVYDQTQEIYALITDYATATGTVTVAAWLDYEDNPSSLTPAAGDSFSITDVKTVDGDLARYWLPDDFQGEVAGDITYAKDTGVGHFIGWAHDSEIRFQREVTVIDSYPVQAVVRPSPARRRWELFVNPAPNEANTVTFPYRAGFDEIKAMVGISTASGDTGVTIGGIANVFPDDYFNGWYAYVVAGTGLNSYAKVTDYVGATGAFTVADWLSIDGSAGGTNPHATAAYIYVTDDYKHPAGPQFDEAILSACLAKAELEFEDIQMGYNEKFHKIDLPQAQQIDARSAPRKLGQMVPGSGRVARGRVWNDITLDS